MNETIKLWLSSLIATFISGSAGAFIVVVADPVAFNFNEQWKKTSMTALAFGLVGVANYLKKSPLPGIDGSKLGIILLCCSIATGSMGASCSTTSGYKRAVQACYDLSVGVNASVQITMALNKQGVLQNDNYLVILEGERSLVLANEEFRKLLVSAKELNTTNRTAFLSLIDNMLTSASDLQTQGILRIKNPKSQATFAGTIATVRVALITLKGFLEQIKNPQPLPTDLKALALPIMGKEYNQVLVMKEN